MEEIWLYKINHSWPFLLSPPASFSQGRPLPEAAYRKAGQTFVPVLLKEQQHATGAGSKDIFADRTFRTSCCKSSAPGSGWAICKTQLWSSVARLGMPQADQTSCWIFLETSQHLQQVLPVCSSACRIYGNMCCQCDMGLPCLLPIPSPWCLLLLFKHRLMPDGFNFKFSINF